MFSKPDSGGLAVRPGVRSCGWHMGWTWHRVTVKWEWLHPETQPRVPGKAAAPACPGWDTTLSHPEVAHFHVGQNPYLPNLCQPTELLVKKIQVHFGKCCLKTFCPRPCLTPSQHTWRACKGTAQPEGNNLRGLRASKVCAPFYSPPLHFSQMQSYRGDLPGTVFTIYSTSEVPTLRHLPSHCSFVSTSFLTQAISALKHAVQYGFNIVSSLCIFIFEVSTDAFSLDKCLLNAKSIPQCSKTKVRALATLHLQCIKATVNKFNHFASL